eukprot:scaffold1359_cov158-Alexandrium_tamarense.AAC.1
MNARDADPKMKRRTKLHFSLSRRNRWDRSSARHLDSEEAYARLLPDTLESFQLYSRYHIDDEENSEKEENDIESLSMREWKMPMNGFPSSNNDR